MKHYIIILLSLISLPILSQVKIEMKKVGGVYEIPCEVNGLKLKFIFDTGATYVSLSSSIANFMLEQGYLSKDDIYDETNIIQSDGSKYKAYKVKLRKINVGGLVLNNVDGIISPSQNASLLLGQSALQKLGKVSFKDNYLIINEDKAKYTDLEKDIAFIGLHQGDDQDKCEQIFKKKYGEDKVNYYVTNDKYLTMTVNNDFFILKKFDSISLLFEDNKLSAVELLKSFPFKQKTQAINFRNHIFSFLKDKYKATKRLQNLGSGVDSHLLGYKHKSDNISYPILIETVDCFRVHRTEGEEPIKEHLYEVRLVYWQADYERMMSDIDVPEEY